MPEMITVRCPRCGKKLQFSPFNNYKKATLECPGCHYNGLVESYPEIPAPQSHEQTQQPGHGYPRSNPSPSDTAPSGRSEGNSSGIRDLDDNSSDSSNNSRRGSRSNTKPGYNSQEGQQPSGFALKFPWVITGLAVVIIILYVCLQCISTNEVI